MKVSVKINKMGTYVSPYWFGTNLEHTRADVNSGLSAQMLRNRKFAGKPMPGLGHASEWYPIGNKTFFLLVIHILVMQLNIII